jgi:serine/threonine-protein kinase
MSHGTDDTQVGDSSDPGAGAAKAVPGYALGERIGKGGMGEVVLARDERIGRDVALKRLRAAAPQADAVARFLREARIQARLEHPAIVPVHELGTDPDGRPYFTMKRITGVTLGGSIAGAERPPLQRTLRALADVCLAIEFAHARGVVHRDLKPANVMLGDFGEVYVLDWGLARVTGEHESAIRGDVESLDGMTQAGAVLGSPGYMAPEQIQSAHDVGPAADVYALGSILFEVLAGEPLHPRGAAAALPSTVAGVDGSPARRRPERGVPPELDAICVDALAQDPGDRPSAREVAHRIERYLDGDRDVAHRRSLAASHLIAARAALAAGHARRSEAAQFASRALVLDPESVEAAAVVTSLALEPPRDQPPALHAELAAAEGEVQRRQSRTAKMSFLAIFAYLVIAAWNGLTGLAVVIAIGALCAVLFAVQHRLQRRTASAREMVLVAIGNAAMAALLSRTFGPLLVAPAVCCVMAVSLASYPQLVDRARVLVVPLLVGAWLGPVVLEQLGVLAPTWQVVPGAVISTSHTVAIGGASTVGLLMFANVLAIVVIGLFANALAKSRRDAMRQSATQAWQMRQLVPVGLGARR